MPAADPMSLHEESPGLDDPAVASETTLDSSANPRKRKKSSRACDYCHINHQPCDNAKPRCGYCERHGKNCLYLRPQKKRGPAQGYRSALYSMRESAAAWGAVLHLVPSLAPVIEGYFKKEDGKRLIRAIKDPQQQEFYIQTWQQSSVFKTFFGDDNSPPCEEPDPDPDAVASSQPRSDAALADRPVDRAAPPQSAQQAQTQQAQTQQTQQTHPAQPTHPPRLPQHPVAIPQPPHQSPSHSISPVVPSSSSSGGRPMASGTTGGGGTDLGLHPMQMSFGMPPGTTSQPPLPPPPSQSPAHAAGSTPYLFPPLPQAPLSSLPYDPKLESLLHANPQDASSLHTLGSGGGGGGGGGGIAGLGGSTVSLSDILARAAAQPSNNFSQALGSLGFAPEETLNDFVAMSYNPDILDGDVDTDPLLGSDLDQKAYYELLMGRRYP